MSNRLRTFFVVVFLFLFAVVAALYMSNKADAALAIVDSDKNNFYYSEKYNYYFIIESTPEQGRKIVFSTVPFLAFCDGIQDSSGAYTVELSAPGGDVYVVHFPHINFSAYTNEYENCGSTPVLKFKYSGQNYETNCGFNCGVEFKTGTNIVTGALYSMINYMKSQDVIFEWYPYYFIGYCSSTNKFILMLCQGDLGIKTNESPNAGYVCCYFDASTMTPNGFNSSASTPYLPSLINDVFKLSAQKIASVTSGNNKYYILYSNMTDCYASATGTSDYFYISNNPHPSYDIYTGTIIMTPTPTPTPIPTPIPVSDCTYKYDASAVGVEVKSYAKNQYPNGNGVDTIYIDSKADFQNLYNVGNSYPDSSGLLVSDMKPKVYVDYTVEIAFPSRSYVQHLIKSENGAEALDGMGLVEGSEYYMLNSGVYKNWLNSLGNNGNAEYYTISGRYTYPTYRAFKIMASIKFDPYDSLLSRFSDTASLKAYYGLTEKEWDKVGKYAMLFATPVSCTVRLGYRNSAYGYIYGDTTTTVFSTDGTGKVLVQSVVAGDVITDTDIQRENDYILKKYAVETGNVVNQYIDLSGAFSDLNSSDIWSFFKSATTGLSTVAGSVTHIAFAIGAVFSFLPAGVYNLMYLTLMIVLVCAIIKAVRG